jgi:hypothetical protein
MDKDEAIRELAHVARCLLERLDEVDTSPAIFRTALRNKVECYAQFEEATTDA